MSRTHVRANEMLAVAVGENTISERARRQQSYPGWMEGIHFNLKEG